MALTYSLDSQRKLTETFEGCVLTAYKDQHDVWTIGFGHTGSDVHEGLVWTREQAEQALAKDILWASNIVNTLVKIQLTQGEFDALVDFVFNTGSGAFAKSALLRMVNLGDFDDAAKEFEKWSHVSGKEVAGLLRRRIAEEEVLIINSI